MKNLNLSGLLCCAIVSLGASATAGDILGISWTGIVYDIDSSSGNAINLGSCGYSQMNSLAKHPDGTIYAVSSTGRVVALDPVTGTGTLLVTISGMTSVRGAAFRPDGSLYLLDDVGFGLEDLLYLADLTTGTATLIGGVGAPGVQGLGTDAAGTIYAWEMGTASNGLGLCILDPLTGQASDVNPAVGTDVESQTLFFDAGGQLFGGRYDLFSFNTTTAQSTLVCSISAGGLDIRGMEFVGGGSGVGVPYCAGDGLGTGCPCGNNNNGAMGGCDWGNPLFLDGGVLAAVGSASMSANNTFLVATGIENNFGIFFGANDQVNGGNGNPLNDGLRCAGGALVRLTPPTIASGNQATTPLPVQTLDSGAASGATRRYQYWFRTPGGPCGTSANLTNGYEIAWGI